MPHSRQVTWLSRVPQKMSLTMEGVGVGFFPATAAAGCSADGEFIGGTTITGGACLSSSCNRSSRNRRNSCESCASLFFFQLPFTLQQECLLLEATECGVENLDVAHQVLRSDASTTVGAVDGHVSKKTKRLLVLTFGHTRRSPSSRHSCERHGAPSSCGHTPSCPESIS